MRKGDFMEEILKISKIEKYYGNKSNLTKAIDNISFSVNKGNQKLTYPIGLIMVDEVLAAGGLWEVANNNYYL